MGGYIDGYCERVAPGFWGEPLNSISNLAFLVAAVAAWYIARRVDRPAGPIYALPVIIGLIFLGSSAFHTTATRWGAVLDSGFIAVFLLYYIVLFARLFWDIPWRLAALAAPVFIAFTTVVSLVASAVDFGGPGMYVSALLALFILAALLRASQHAALRAHWPAFVTAGAVFTVSLTFRTLDDPLCGSLPIGTHFLWHTLNAVTLYLVTRAAVRRWQEVSAGLSQPAG